MAAARRFPAFVLLACGAALPAPAASAADEPTGVLAGTVTRVIDGDTLDVQLSSGPIRVRLHGIDAPERDQPAGLAATAWLREQLASRPVTLEPVSQDQYERMVAVVYLQDRSINRELVELGHAWAYRRYMRRSDEILCRLEYRARSEGAGLWAAAANAPWEFRSTQGKGPFTSYAGSTVEDCARAIGR